MSDVTIGEKLSDIRAPLTRTRLTADDRGRIVEQALVILGDLYVHLDQKRALYGVDALTRLRQLQRQAAELADAEFHAALMAIFHDLHDGHTYYQLPRPYQAVFVSLGFLVERCWVNDAETWLVSHVLHDVAGEDLVPGAEITHWNGIPIAVAVARHAADEWGSNPAAMLARGLDNMTQRWLGQSAVPDEDWVDLRFLRGGKIQETRIPWRQIRAEALLEDTDDEINLVARAAGPPPIGADRKTLAVQRMKAALFATSDSAPQELATGLPNLRAGTVTTPDGTFGHLRIYSFTSRVESETFLGAIADLLPQMPPDGLIVDVRGNGGGLIGSAEGLLQMLTPRRIEPEQFQFRITESTATLVKATSDVDTFTLWADTLDESLAIGAQYSPARPFSSEDSVNDRGQLYYGPVVLVTDALCYSATDILAAGFQDHSIGLVLGIDAATGAGGASIFTATNLALLWPRSPFARLPQGAEMGMGLLRALRVRRNFGRPLEDVGVTPDVLYRITPEDLLEHNAGLMAAAGALLVKGRSVRFMPTVDRAVGRLRLETRGVTSVDVYENGRPITTSGVIDGENIIEMAGHDLSTTVVRIDGYRDADLVASRTLVPVGPP